MTEATSEYDLNTPNNLHQTVWPKLSLSGKKFIGNDVSCLVLGDNFFHGNDFSALLCEAVRTTEEDKKNYRIRLLGKRFGTLRGSRLRQGRKLSFHRGKPQYPKLNYAVVGLYFYPNKVIEVAKNIKSSARDELKSRP